MSKKNVLKKLLKEGKVIDPNCPNRKILSHITSRWGTLVLILLRNEKLRFSEIRQKINGVSERMLATVLLDLEDDGLLIKEPIRVIPSAYQYRLTKQGYEVSDILVDLTDWIANHIIN